MRFVRRSLLRLLWCVPSTQWKRGLNDLIQVNPVLPVNPIMKISLDRSVEISLSPDKSLVIGVDEAGRGPLAGPVVAAAVYIPSDLPLVQGICDSKVTTEADREAAYEALLKVPGLRYCVCAVEPKEIDELNILYASLTAMRRATLGLLGGIGAMDVSLEQIPGVIPLPNDVTPWSTQTFTSLVSENSTETLQSAILKRFYALVDGNKWPADMPVEGRPVIKGDSRVYTIAAASIFAKVVRDRLMVDLDHQYPQFQFAKHKGYPTDSHRRLVMQHGPSDVHRYSYRPVQDAARAHGLAHLIPSRYDPAIILAAKGASSKSKKQTTKKPSVTKAVVKSKRALTKNADDTKIIKKEKKKFVEVPEVGLRRSPRFRNQ